MPRPDSLPVAVLLAALFALGPLSTDMYLPALPAMSRSLGTGVGPVQLTLSVFLVGFAVSQLVMGPLSDRFGRRPVLLVGLAVYLVATLACVFAPSIEALIAARFFQSLGACTGVVLGRAVVRDVYGRARTARMLAYMSAAMAVAPLVAPIIGGYVVVWFDWRAVFMVLAAFGLTMLVLVAAFLRETNEHLDVHAARPGPMIRNYVALFTVRRYVGYMLTNAFVYSGLFAFISGSPFVLIDFLGLEPRLFGLSFATIIVGYMAGTLTAGRLTLGLGVDTMVLLGSVVALASGVAAGILAWAGADHVAAVVAPMFFYMVGMGIVMPNCMAGAIAPFPAMAGTVSALLGFVQMGLAALVGVLVGQFHDGTQAPMTTAIAAMGVCTFAGYFMLIRRRREGVG
ncbi:MAG: multidrug effflux MFS transporter [Rhodospirillales bacterium]|jgi:DHA1 family bicyclomycin/chloramphenicol resistance-like MFS transporter|nr:multidrug effflux MFS transporter [Rhodospirillales bacterium]MDP6774110.1 multidrug effflux MFS transporter [Rhodospirillales bacterium]